MIYPESHGPSSPAHLAGFYLVSEVKGHYLWELQFQHTPTWLAWKPQRQEAAQRWHRETNPVWGPHQVGLDLGRPAGSPQFPADQPKTRGFL